MITKTTILQQTARFRVLSAGHGRTLVFQNRTNGEAVLIQTAPEVVTFMNTLDQLVAGSIRLSYDNALGVLWTDYYVDAEPSRVAQPVPADLDTLIWDRSPNAVPPVV